MHLRLEENEHGYHLCERFAERLYGGIMVCSRCLSTWHEGNVIRKILRSREAFSKREPRQTQ